MDTFTFSTRTSIKEAFAIFKRHIGFFIGITLVTIVLNIVGGEHTPLGIQILLGVAAYIWTIMWLKLSLSVARGNEHILNLASLPKLLPTAKEVIYMFLIGLVVGFLTICGLIMLIIPGIYIGFRLTFATLAYLDRKEGVRPSVRYAWKMTKGKVGIVFVTLLAVAGLYLVGILALGIGLFITYPLAAILTAKLYVALSDDFNKKEAVVVQPVEIPADLPEVATA